MTSEFIYWKNSKYTFEILKNVEEEIERIKKHLEEGVLLSHDNSDHLAREYARKVGTIEGLKLIERFLTNEYDDRETT